MNTPGRIKFSQLPALSEVDDSDEVLFRDVDGEDPAQQVGRLSIATLRAAMGGSPDRIESASGEAFVEASKFNGSPRTIARSGVGMGYAIQSTFSDGDKSSSELIVKGAGSPSAGIRAEFDEGVYTLSAHGAPFEVEAPTEDNHAATKGYVDSRPGAEGWSGHPAAQDVDLDGHKLTGLGAPTEEDDAATKGYVDSASPAKIERTFSWGRSVAEVTDDGNIELAVYLTGQTDPLRRVRVPRGNAGGAVTIMNRSGMGPTAWVNTFEIVDHAGPGFSYALSGGTGSSTIFRGSLMYYNGRWAFAEQNGSLVYLGSDGYYALPGGVSSIKHGVHLAKQAHDRRADLQWWDPVWTPVSNVDSVTNVECSYTRTYRAAGGSLVTLEGTITVTPEALADDSLIFSCPLPVPQVGSAEPLGWVGDTENIPGSMCRISGGLLGVSIESANDAVRTASFRISYRAA